MSGNRKEKAWMIWAFLCGLLYIFLISLVVHIHTHDSTASSQAPVIQSTQKDSQNSPKLTVFDLGIGNASVIQLPDHKAVLINTGDLVSANKFLQQLQGLAIDQIDTVILTDTDYRHTGGLGILLQEYPVKQVLLPKDCPKSVIRMLDEQNVVRRTVTDAIQKLQIDTLQFDLLPDSDTPNRLSFRCSYGKSAVWFIDPAFTPSSKLETPNNNMDVLTVIDHGYVPFSTIKWIEQWNTHYVVLTSIEGIDNTVQTFNNLEIEGIYSFRSDQQGGLTFALGNKGISLLSTISFDETSQHL